MSNPSRVPDKFAPRGVPCVFLGYPANQKGYKFFKLQNRTDFVSRDATFYEHIFPFDSESMQQFLSPLPTTLPCQFSTNYSEEVQNHFPLPNINSDNTNDPQNESSFENPSSSPSPESVQQEVNQPQVSSQMPTRKYPDKLPYLQN